MASITKDTHQPPKSPFWIACFNGVGSNGEANGVGRSQSSLSSTVCGMVSNGTLIDYPLGERERALSTVRRVGTQERGQCSGQYRCTANNCNQ